MKVLFEITHPAHVHLFRNAINALLDRDHDVIVTARDKELTIRLLDDYGIEHRLLSTAKRHKLSSVTEWALREVRLLRVAMSFQPDVMVSQINPAAAHVSRLTGATCIIFNDGENTDVLSRITYPFADAICTPERFGLDYGPKHRRYPGYHELAYLHPNRFTPDLDRLEDHGIGTDEPYAVLRFISLGAYHDVGQQGLTDAGKHRLVERLAEIGPVYVSSEIELPPELKHHELSIPPALVHDLLAGAALFAGDSGTMATEAAVLGTPAIRVGTHLGGVALSNFIELEERYGLLYTTTDEDEAIEQATAFIDDREVKEVFQRRREQLLSDKIDVTTYIVETILEYGRRSDHFDDQLPTE